MRRTGWIKLFRSEDKLSKALVEVEKLKPFGLTCDILDSAGVREREPNLAEDILGAVHYRDPVCINDPAALSLAYLRLFESRGGLFVAGDARTLRQDGTGWSHRHAGRAAAVARRRGGDGAVVGPRDEAVRLRFPDRGEARLPHALRAGGERRAQPHRARRR